VVERREVDRFDSGVLVLLEEKWSDRVEEQGAPDHPGRRRSAEDAATSKNTSPAGPESPKPGDLER
jgi:hypothetical protein